MGRRFISGPRALAEAGSRINGKDRQYANMGLPGIFGYRDQKGCIVADSGLCCVFHILHTLAPVASRAALDCTNIPGRRLELVCDDDARNVLVLGEFKVDG